MPGDRRRPDVDGDAERGVDVARPDGDDHVRFVDGDGRLVPLDRPVQIGEHVESNGRLSSAVLLSDGAGDKLGRRLAGARFGTGPELGRLDAVDVEQREARVDGDRWQVEVLADHLAMDLAGRRDVDDDVAVDVRRATEAMSGNQRPVAAVVRLDRCRRAERVRRDGDRPLREAADAGHDLAATADRRAHRTPCRGRRPAGAPRRARSCRARRCRSDLTA